MDPVHIMWVLWLIIAGALAGLAGAAALWMRLRLAPTVAVMLLLGLATLAALALYREVARPRPARVTISSPRSTAPLRGYRLQVDGVVQPGVAPRFSATPGLAPGPEPVPGADTTAYLLAHGFDADEVAELVASGAVVQA